MEARKTLAGESRFLDYASTIDSPKRQAGVNRSASLAELKTRLTDERVKQFIEAITDKTRQGDCRKILQIMKKVAKTSPRMWGKNLVGFGSYPYRSDRGCEGDWFLTGFSLRNQDLTFYLMSGLERRSFLRKKLDKHKTGKSCLYIKRLGDIDLEVLTDFIRVSVKHVCTRGK